MLELIRLKLDMIVGEKSPDKSIVVYRCAFVALCIFMTSLSVFLEIISEVIKY